ncbi:MAG: hypothetical protein ACYDCL_22180 [Myxococcales bacterium]
MRAFLPLALLCVLPAACVVATTPPCTGACGNNGGNNGGGTTGGTDHTGVILGPANATTLLVDNEWSGDFTSPSYQLFTGLLTGAGINFDTFVTAADSTPTAVDLGAYDTLVWFSGASYGDANGTPTLSKAQEAIVETWLDHGGRTLLMFSENLVYDLSDGSGWAGPETDTFLANYLGLAGDAADFPCHACSADTVLHQNYTVTGVAGTALAGQQYDVIGDTPIKSSADAVNPGAGAGVDVLATTPGDPDTQGSDFNVPVIVGRKGVGAAGSSQIVYVGVCVEDFPQGMGAETSLFNGVLNYAGL